MEKKLQFVAALIFQARPAQYDPGAYGHPWRQAGQAAHSVRTGW